MEKKNYYAPSMEKFSMEAEMPVICSSAPHTKGNLSGFNPSAGAIY